MRNINRRSAIQHLSVAAAGLHRFESSASAADMPLTTGLGVVMYDCNLRRAWMKEKDDSFDLFRPVTFVDHCKAIGAGGVHVALGVMSPDEASRFRDLVAKHGMFVDAILKAPQDKNDLQRFEAEVKTAAAVGVQSARTTIIPGRRYERFKSFEEFQEFERRGTRMVELAAPIVERHRVPLAIENHKDQRIDDRLELYQHIDSEYVGACVDTGNSIALLDDAYAAVEALAPHAMSVHLKDQSLAEYEDGFLLGDVPLGQGSLDLERMVSSLRKNKPDLQFSLEVITRNPLKVPCLTEAYWRSVPDAGGADLADTIRLIRGNETRGQVVSSLSRQEQVRLEDENIAASLKYAREVLKI